MDHLPECPALDDIQPGWDWVRRLILPDGDRYGDQARPE